MWHRLAPWLRTFIVFFMTPSSSMAQGRVPITWEVPHGLDCISPASLAQEVEARLRQPLDLDLELEVHGRAERSSAGVRATLELRTHDEVLIGTRTVETEGECHGLDDVLPVVIAMMLNVPREELALFVRTRPEPPPPQPELPEPAPREFRAGNETSVSSVLVAGVLPDVALGARLMSMAVIDGFSAIALDVIAIPEHVRPVENGVIMFRLMSIGVGTCAMGALIESWFRLEGCVGIRVDALWVEPSGFEENRSAMTWMLGGDVAGRVLFRLWGPLWAGVGLGVHVPLPSSAFAYRAPTGEIHEIHRVAPLAGRLDFGLALRFE